MFYACLLPTLMLSAIMIIKLRRIRKHDVVLYQFCQIRRDAIRLIDERGDSFGKAGYFATRNLLENLNLMIHNYDGCKIHVFNFRRVLETLKEYKHSSRQIEKIQVPDDEKILELHNRFRRAMVEAFLAYTPWIRSEILARIVLLILQLLAKIGNKTIQSAGEYLAWLIDEMKHSDNQKRPHCLA